MSFSEFQKAIIDISKKFEKLGVSTRVETDSDSQIIRIYGSDFTPLDRAKNGIEDVLELSYTTAEHHPYWSFLYNSGEIIKSTLEKWNTNFTKEEMEEIEWAIKELKHACDKIKERNLGKDK